MESSRFIATEDKGIKKSVIHYILSTLTSLIMLPLLLLLITLELMSSLDLLMRSPPQQTQTVWFSIGKLLGYQCGLLWLCIIVSMVMTITDLWKLFWYEVKRDHYDKFISNRELLQQLAFDLFNNNFKSNTRNMKTIYTYSPFYYFFQLCISLHKGKHYFWPHYQIVFIVWICFGVI